MFRLISVVLICGFYFFGSPVFAGSLLVTEDKLTAGLDAAADDQFGHSVAISGDTAVVGARNDDAGSNSGSVYVFVRSGSTWSEQQKLTASDANAGDLFGDSVAISGDSVVVGAWQDDGAGQNAGAAYVFVRSGSTWSEQQKLTASDANAGDLFGDSVAISGDRVVVGAFLNDDAGTGSGSAYVFVRSGTNWSEEDKLTANDGAANDSFGGSVSISGDTVVVGALGDDDGGNQSGSAYVFVRSGTNWIQQQKLTASDAAPIDSFGGSVAVSGDTVVAGAISDDDKGSNSGSAYVFVRSGSSWTQQAKLKAGDGAANDQFGGSVAVSGDTVVVGALGNDDGGETSGSAYVFVRSGTKWVQQAKLTASDANTDDRFGESVAVSRDTVVVGATGDDDGGSRSGSAYVLKRLFSFQGPMTGTMFCRGGLGGIEKEKFKENATIDVDTGRFPVITADVRMKRYIQSFTLTGIALLKNPKSGVLQLFGDNGAVDLALSGSIKINKKTGVWSKLNGKFQLRQGTISACTLAGKFKAE